MKFAYLTTVYPSYAEAFCGRNQDGLADRPYATQLAALATDTFGWNGAWGPALAPLGYEVLEILSNIRPLQQSWASEHGVAWRPDRWRTEIPYLQLRSFQPDVLLMDDPRAFDRNWLIQLRERCPSLKLILGFCGSPAYDLDTLQACDAVLSCIKPHVDFFGREGCRSFLLRHAFNPAVLASLPAWSKPVAEVSFVGSVVRAAGYHLEREQLLEAIVAAIPLSLYSPQSEIGFWRDFADTTARRGIYVLLKWLKAFGVDESTCRRLPMIGRAATWTRMPLRQINWRLKPHMKPPVYGLEMYSVLQRSAVTINKHIDIAGDAASNCRLFEATGIGTCLLTDWKADLSEIFKPDQEVVSYRSVGECVEKARWLLSHPTEREAIGRAGQARTLREHTFSHRAVELDAIIQELLKKNWCAAANETHSKTRSA